MTPYHELDQNDPGAIHPENNAITTWNEVPTIAEEFIIPCPVSSEPKWPIIYIQAAGPKCTGTDSSYTHLMENNAFFCGFASPLNFSLQYFDFLTFSHIPGTLQFV